MLDATDITVEYGGVRAVAGATLHVDGDEILGLVGPNGSGKSSLLNALTGVGPGVGQVRVDGHDLPLGRPAAARRLGLVRTYQTAQTFTSLTCLENALLATPDRRRTGLAAAWFARRAMRRHETDRWERAMAALDRVGLADVATAMASELSYGQQRLLEVARAIAAEPRLVMLDEPAAGLNDAETARLAELLQGMRADGIALLVVEHKVDFLTRLCDRFVVLAMGQVIAQGDPDAVWRDDAVIEAYLGTNRRRRHARGT